MRVNWVETTGVIHVHSRYSDGTATVEEILAVARAAHVDFVLLSDHDTLAARREGWEGVHDGVSILVAAEITPARQGHVLAMRVQQCAGYAVQPNTRTLDAVRAQGGYAVIAHPMGKHKPSLLIHQSPWYDWEHPAVRGLEIWSYLHDWIEEVAWWRLPQAYEFWKHPQRKMTGPDPFILRTWDRLGRTRRLSGLAGLDCHARRVPLAGIEIFPYADMFRALRNHLFIPADATGADARIAALWEAMAEGRGYICHDVLADGAGVVCHADLPGGRRVLMGQEAPFCDGTVMRISLPHRAEIRWIADGACRRRETARDMEAVPAGPGVYRFEARLDGCPWFYANPFYLR